MAKLSRGATNARLREARNKVRLVFIDGNWMTTSTAKKLNRIMDDLADVMLKVSRNQG